MERELQRLKIAFVSDMNGTAGSGAMVSAQIFTNHLRQNHDVVVISTDVHADVKLRGIRLRFLQIIKHLEIVLALPSRKTLRKAFADVDIVHLHLPFWLSFVALDEAHKAGKPVVASFHVQPENMLYNIHIRWSWLNRKIYQFWVNHLWNRADLVLCPSLFAKKKLQGYGLKAPVKAISNGSFIPPSHMKYEREVEYKDYFFNFYAGKINR